jgi:hypothetical protein
VAPTSVTVNAALANRSRTPIPQTLIHRRHPDLQCIDIHRIDNLDTSPR